MKVCLQSSIILSQVLHFLLSPASRDTFYSRTLAGSVTWSWVLSISARPLCQVPAAPEQQQDTFACSGRLLSSFLPQIPAGRWDAPPLEESAHPRDYRECLDSFTRFLYLFMCWIWVNEPRSVCMLDEKLHGKKTKKKQKKKKNPPDLKVLTARDLRSQQEQLRSESRKECVPGKAELWVFRTLLRAGKAYNGVTKKEM